METLLTVEEYQQHIRRYLSNHSSGYVHSVFRNGLNIQMGSDSTLFFIGTTDNGRNPFGIHLQREAVHQLVANVEKNEEIHWDTLHLALCFLSSHFVINFNGAKAFEDRLYLLEGVPHAITQFEAFIRELVLNEESTGSGIDIEAFLLDYGLNHPPEDPINQSVHGLLKGLFSQDTASMEETIRYVMGRGEGLTPSGDDHLVGILAIGTITGAFAATFSNVIQTLLTHESLTTDVAKTYLQYALEGYFSSDIVHLTEKLFDDDPKVDIRPDMHQLLAFGHSSGVDTAFGMLIGMLALRRK